MLGKLKELISGVRQNNEYYECPFCLNYSNKFDPIGFDFPVLIKRQVVGGGRRFTRCKTCGSIDRERLVFLYLREIYGIFNNKNKTILHFAPEVQLSKRLLEFGFQKYVCGDLFAEGYHYPEHVQNINVLSIPFEDNTFDFVICNHVLEHIQDDRAAMREILRVLKKGGQALLQVPISKNSVTTFEDFSIGDPKQREIVFGQADHIRIYGQDYALRLEECGFEVTRLNIYEQFKKYGIIREEDIFICKR
ncbi:MAG: methyltransferase domain-containing protein [Chitinophagaceae bacterium]|nr:methyltransferase domain-containing protein [Chitinophagaceae bacterium]